MGRVGWEREVHACEAICRELMESLNDLGGLTREAEVPNDFRGDESRFVGFEVGVVTLVQLLMRSILVSGRVKREVVGWRSRSPGCALLQWQREHTEEQP